MSGIRNVKSIVPLLDRILVQRAKAQTQTSSGIYIPEKNVEKLNVANVIATGPGLENTEGKIVPPTVQSGDRVLIPPFGGSPVKVGNDEYILFRNHEILAKVEQE